MTELKKQVTFRISRMGEDKNSYTEDFTLECTNATTILQALETIKGEQDGSLTFRRSCRASICGSCGMFINNRSRLACRTKVKDMVDLESDEQQILEIAPQKNQPVIKDLVVDITPFYEKVENHKPYVQDGPEKVINVDKTSYEQVNMVSNCIMCGSCYSDCTALAENENYLGPAALAKMFRFVADPREGQKKKRLKELSKKNGIWDCTRCGLCIDACPKDVAPMEAIVKLRSRAIEAGVTNNKGAKHAMVFKNDLAKHGLLNEFWMIPKTFGLLGAIKQIPNAIHLAKKGKVPSPMPEKIEGVEEIDAIFKQLKENPINVETRKEDDGPGAG
jgi:succinate dehydrogenase / fumarate reductase iron-sulfur subunit